MRIGKRVPLSMAALMAVGALFWILARTPAIVAAGPLSNGSFDRFQPLTSNGRANAWQKYPERLGTNWQMVKVAGGDSLHLFDSYTLALFQGRVMGKPLSNVCWDGRLSQAFATSVSFDIAVFQSAPVQVGQTYTFRANVVTFWLGQEAQRDDAQVYKRVGIDPLGGSNISAASIVWSGWQAVDKQWVTLTTSAVAGATKMTVFVEVQAPNASPSDAHITTGYIDGAVLELTSPQWTPTPYYAPTSTPTRFFAPTPTPTPYHALTLTPPPYYAPTLTPPPYYVPTVTPPPYYAPTATPSVPPTSTPTPYVAPTSTVTPTPTPTWVYVVETPSPTAVYISEPTPMATQVPSGSYFRLKTVRMLTITENGGCMGNHHIFLSVLDGTGNPLLGVTIGDPPNYNFRVITGQKYEPFLDWGTKLAEISLYSSGTRVQVVADATGAAAVSDQTPLLSTNTWEIPAAWLVQAGYCSGPDCGTLLCQGHYSYWVVFQQATQ